MTAPRKAKSAPEKAAKRSPRPRNQPLQKQLSFTSREPRSAFREIRNYLAGRFLGSTRDEALLDEVIKVLFCKMYIELGHSPAPTTAAPSAAALAWRKIFEHVRTDHPTMFAADDVIRLDDDSLLWTLDACAFSVVDGTADVVGDAFEVFAGSEARGRSGQFFTPLNSADLLADMVRPLPSEHIIDPACGAGGLLAAVLRRHLREGLSRDSLAEVASRLHGVDKDNYLARLARLHVSALSGGEPEVQCGDSLALISESGSELASLVGKFDAVITNPPFGARIVSASPSVLARFELARKWRQTHDKSWQPTGVIRTQVPPQILFVERCLSLLRDGGRFGIVLPESVLSNKSHRYMVNYLMEHARVEAVVGMPEELFKTSGKGGTHTKTCLVTGQRDDNRARGRKQVFMAEARWCGRDSRGRVIPHDDLPKIATAYEAWRKDHPEPASTLGFVMEETDIKEAVLRPKYYDPLVEGELAALAETCDLVPFGKLVEEGVLSLATGDELGKLAYGTGDVPFVRTSDISNWEIKIDAKHRVSEDIYERLRVRQDVKALDILMVRDGTYLVGTCGIVGPGEERLLYQSHIFKIRVNENQAGITPYLLLALLSTKHVQRQIRAKRFTQDIIDSLGDRIHELILPVPKKPERRAEIQDLVEASVRHRQEARRLARRARALAQNDTDLSLQDSPASSLDLLQEDDDLGDGEVALDAVAVS